MGETAVIVGPAGWITTYTSPIVVLFEATASTRISAAGTVAGAEYRPVAVIVPSVAFPPTIPFTCQVTAVFVKPLTVAVYWSWVETPIVEYPGLIEIAGAVVAPAMIGEIRARTIIMSLFK